jgi:cytochrome c oxidase cbb3-type subunit IV
MDLNINLIRSIVTVLAFIVFVLLVVRVWRSANRERHAEAAALPFADEPIAPSTLPSPRPSPASGRGSNADSPPGQQGSHRLPLPLAGEGWGRDGGFEPHAASPASDSGLQARMRTASEGHRQEEHP